jgi:hypothetical protein
MLRIAIVGGSNSVIRGGYSKYLEELLALRCEEPVCMEYFSLGGVTSLYGAIQNLRFNIPANHDVILFEYCVNDRNALQQGFYSLEFMGKAVEGFVRLTRRINPSCIIIFLVFGINYTWYYDSCCMLSALYSVIAQRYDIPCINITEIVLKQGGIEAVRRLYAEDPYHYARPKGALRVAEIICNQIIGRKMLNKTEHRVPYRIYADNFENISLCTAFDPACCEGVFNMDSFTNNCCQETGILTLFAGSSYKTSFQGKLLALIVLSEENAGLVKIRAGKREIIASTLSSFVRKLQKPIISMLVLPPDEDMICESHASLEITAHAEMPDKCYLDWHKELPESKRCDWKISIIGLVYIGEIYSDKLQ